MANTKIIENQNQLPTGATANDKPENEADVLYQRIGNRWYVFSVVEDEVYMGSLSVDEVQAFEEKNRTRTR